MIKGIGTDIIEISRIKSIMKKDSDSFLNKIFSDIELEYYKDNYKNESIAGGFAAKEAIMKALGTGLRGFSFKDIRVIRNSLGKPYVQLEGKAKKIASDQEISTIHLSISHSKEYAIAFAVAE